jgi:FkbM family methyltransferase
MTRFVLKVLLKLRLLTYFNAYVRLADGMVIPVLGGMGYYNIYGTEKWMSSILQEIVPGSKGVFVDIGVNVGQTLIKLRKIDKSIEYIGFEPNPVCVFYAEKLVSKNGFPNTKIIPIGISNGNGLVTLKYFTGDSTDSSASIIDNFRTSKVFQEKSIVVLNSDIIDIGRKIDFVKIDVEGAELMVLEGFRKFIVRDRPCILIEILPVYTAENQDRLLRQNSILSMLKEIDYAILKVIKNPDDTFMQVDLITEIGIHSDITHCDYLFVPKETAGNIQDSINSGR